MGLYIAINHTSWSKSGDRCKNHVKHGHLHAEWEWGLLGRKWGNKPISASWNTLKSYWHISWTASYCGAEYWLCLFCFRYSGGIHTISKPTAAHNTAIIPYGTCLRAALFFTWIFSLVLSWLATVNGGNNPEVSKHASRRPRGAISPPNS